MSSSINALAAVTVEDLIKPYTNMSEKHLSWISKGLSEWIVLVYIYSEWVVYWTLIQFGGNWELKSLLFAGLAYGTLCIGMAGLASLMGGILQVERICFILLWLNKDKNTEGWIELFIIQSFVGFCGRLCLGFIIYYRNQPFNLSDMCLFTQAVISIFGVIGGPSLGLFALGILCPFANSKVSLSSFNWTLIQHCKLILFLGSAAQFTAVIFIMNSYWYRWS